MIWGCTHLREPLFVQTLICAVGNFLRRVGYWSSIYWLKTIFPQVGRWFNMGYPLVIEHGDGQFPLIYDFWVTPRFVWSFPASHDWLLEGTPSCSHDSFISMCFFSHLSIFLKSNSPGPWQVGDKDDPTLWDLHGAFWRDVGGSHPGRKNRQGDSVGEMEGIFGGKFKGMLNTTA